MLGTTGAGRGAEVVARLFSDRPERLLAAWRRVRAARPREEQPVSSLIDGLVEPFLREIGRSLAGARGHPWTRCQAMLRVSGSGAVGRYGEEFSALLQCSTEAIRVLGGQKYHVQQVSGWIRDAAESATCIALRTLGQAAPPPRVPFGGLVVQVFDKGAPCKPAVTETEIPILH